jgi:hypothetical protein
MNRALTVIDTATDPLSFSNNGGNFLERLETLSGVSLRLLEG